MDLLKFYLDIKEKIIKPSLEELEPELKKFYYRTNIIDGKLNEDILNQNIEEFHFRNNYSLIKLQGQIALKIYSEEQGKDIVVVGFHNPSSMVVVANPKDRNPIVLGVGNVENKLIKDCVIHKLFSNSLK